MDKVITAIIVDDERPGRTNLRCALAAHPRWRVVAECPGNASAREALAASTVDVVFLDIGMPGESGMVLARELSARPEPPLIIFVTAHNAYAVDAFDIHALDYLLKPLRDERLAQALARAEALLAARPQPAYAQALRAGVEAIDSKDGAPLTQLNVRSIGMIEVVRLDDVLWMEAAGNYVELRLAERRILHRMPLSQLERHLDPRHFMRVHRSAIVSVGQMAALASIGDGSWRLTLHCGDQVDVSGRHIKLVRQRMGIDPPTP